MLKQRISGVTLSLAICIVSVILLPNSSEGRCGICNANGIACVSETAFLLCNSDGEVIPTQTYECPTGNICTANDERCEVPDGKDIMPTCTPDAKGCGCSYNLEMFACVSRTKYTICHSRSTTNQMGVCPNGLICNPNGGEICVSPADAEPACDRD